MKINNEKLRRAIEKLSEETMVSALEAYGISLEPPKPKPEFKPIFIHRGCFVVSAEKGEVKIETGSCYAGACFQTPECVDKFIAALQSAKDFIERNRK